MTPADFRDQIVKPNIAEFDADRLSLRRALNALASVDALAAHMFAWLQTNHPSKVTNISDDSHYRANLSAQNADFHLVRDAAKAQKHVVLTRGTPQTSTASQMQSRNIGWGEAGWGDGPWGGGPAIAIELDSGSLAIAFSTLSRALAFLEQEMTTQGM